MGNEVTKAQVRARALQLWEESGRPLGKDLEFWLQAERELNSDDATNEARLDANEAKKGGSES